MTFEDLCFIAMRNDCAVSITDAKDYLGVRMKLIRGNNQVDALIHHCDFKNPQALKYIVDDMIYRLTKQEEYHKMRLVGMPGFPEAAGDAIKEISKKLEESKDD